MYRKGKIKGALREKIQALWRKIGFQLREEKRKDERRNKG
jgi:hypothetical protein